MEFYLYYKLKNPVLRTEGRRLGLIKGFVQKRCHLELTQNKLDRPFPLIILTGTFLRIIKNYCLLPSMPT